MALGLAPVKYSPLAVSEGSRPSLNAFAFRVAGSLIVMAASKAVEDSVGSEPSKVYRITAPSVALVIDTVTGTRPLAGLNTGISAMGGIQSCSTDDAPSISA